MALQAEMVSCGDCRKCLAGGRVHGPYWYSYRRENGRVVSEYIGKVVTEAHADEGHPAGATPEDLFPERVEELRQHAQADAERREAELSEDQRTRLNRVTTLQADVRRHSRRRAKAEDAASAAEHQHEADAARAHLVTARAALRVAMAPEAETSQETVAGA